ncbi:protein kinase domain-containing protein [Actinomycetospora termitidis]|uniref:non-specific serine/threonine protein kinase n=1 Tax=Actinomycetospora termitidis TaxID=3053470 RepID=A0ABT7MDG5_9PSEU|nr:protein kinase [Actinomycetospora sp. Odt1-22]MDL5158709.1 protein kinase [Actinomycetospora sp. Odt1-22]
MEPDTEHGARDGEVGDGGTVVTLDAAAVPATVGDRFDLGERLGRGASATVYRAHDRVLGRDVAVKLFAPGVGTLESASVRRELQAAAQVSHPGVLEVFDVGEAPGPDGSDRVFLVTRLVPGGSLADTLERGALPPEVVVGLAGELLAALAHVHALGIVHRDVKPANILLDPVDAEPDDGPGPARVHPVLADFGVAAVATATTVHGQVTGTAAYLAPEQVRGDEVGSPADVYALGLVLLECLTGRREFPGGPVESSVARLHRDPVVPAELPDDLRDLLVAMTATAPVDRPSAEAARARLRALAPVLGLDEETLAVPAAALAAAPEGLPARSPIVIGPPTTGVPAGPAAPAAPAPLAVPAGPPLTSGPGAATVAAAPTVVTGGAVDLPTGPVVTPPTRSSTVRRGLLGAAAVLVLAGGVVGGVVLTGSSSPLTPGGPEPLPAVPAAAAPAPAVPGTAPAAQPVGTPTEPSAADPTDPAAEDGDDGGDAALPDQPTPGPAPAPGAPPAPAPPAACRSVVSSITGAGASVRVVFTNRGDATCTLTGFPAVSFVGGGKTVGKPASRAGTRGPAVPLAPGGSVAATLKIVPVSEFDAKNCQAVAVSGLRVRAPGTKAAATLPRTGKACSGKIAKPQLTVTTVAAL